MIPYPNDHVNSSALLTDLYQLTMLAGYFEQGMHERQASFDLFFRSNPFNGGYAVFAGLGPALEYLKKIHFSDADLRYLDSLGIFKPRFLDFLKDLRFHGKVTAPREGTVVFSKEPLITVEGNMAEIQLVESALLNIINFQTLIATKASRIQLAAGKSSVVEFGLRRAQGPDGGLSEARAACIGGVRRTSNVLAGQVFDISVKGTHAHSWVMAFDDELEAFRAYARTFPDNSILLIDTYDTLKSGLPNALTVAHELREKGHELRGVRLDSGDLCELSKAVRTRLDEEGFHNTKIVASSDLDEYEIQRIRDNGGKIDIYGVGTQLAVAGGPGGGALGGVYKLVEFSGKPRMKTTSDIEKATLPGKKSLFRLSDKQGLFLQDVIGRESDTLEEGQDLYETGRSPDRSCVPDCTIENIRDLVMKDGSVLVDTGTLTDGADFCRRQVDRLPEGVRRFEDPEVYPVLLSLSLYELREELTARYAGGCD